MPPGALWLPLGAIAFYLYDSLLWLYGDELVLIRRARRWDHAAGSDRLLFRRRLYLPNPLTPQRPLWRACWSDFSRRDRFTDLSALASLVQTLRPLRALVTLLWWLIVVALPVAVVSGARPIILLALFAAVYSVAAIAVAWLWRQRATLGLSARSCRALSFDALACPPFAINLVRKISLLTTLRGELLTQARGAFDASALASLRATLIRRVNELLAVEAVGSVRHTALTAYHSELMEQGTCPATN
jgi:hypothetical protein